MKNSLFCNYDRVFSSLLLLYFELEESQMHLNLPPRKKHQLSPAGLRQLFCFSSFRLCARRQLIRRTVVATLTLGGPARLRRRNTLHLDVDGADRKICLPLTSYTETHTRGIPWPLQGALDSGPEFIKTISSSFSSLHLSHRARGQDADHEGIWQFTERWKFLPQKRRPEFTYYHTEFAFISSSDVRYFWTYCDGWMKISLLLLSDWQRDLMQHSNSSIGQTLWRIFRC